MCFWVIAVGIGIAFQLSFTGGAIGMSLKILVAPEANARRRINEDNTMEEKTKKTGEPTIEKIAQTATPTEVKL